MIAEHYEALAERTLAAIPTWRGGPDHLFHAQQADRERVASDLGGLRQHDEMEGGRFTSCSPRAQGCECPDRDRYEAGLRRTAALYGVSE